MGTGSSLTDGRELDGGPEEALFFPFALFLDLVSRGAIGDPMAVAAAPARTSSSPDNNVSPSELKSSGCGSIPDVLRGDQHWHPQYHLEEDPSLAPKLIRGSRLGDSHGQHSDISRTRVRLSGHCRRR